MALTKFSLEEYIAHPEKKVVTRDGRRVEILSVTCKVRESQPILAQIECAKKSFTLEYYYKNGTALDKNHNLFFADEEPEFTEFEKKLWEIMKAEGSPIGSIEKFTENDKRCFHLYGEKLLELAKKQLIPEFSATHYNEVMKAREEDKAEALKECNGAVGDDARNKQLEIWFEKGKTQGRDEALKDIRKDLPTWHKVSYNPDIAMIDEKRNLYYKGYKIQLIDLEKLPGFEKE